MENLIVTIEGCSLGPLMAQRVVHEKEGLEILSFEGEGIAEEIFLQLKGATMVDVRVQNQPLGLYSLHNTTSNRLVLAKATIESA